MISLHLPQTGTGRCRYGDSAELQALCDAKGREI